jgi:hypothetical protein
MVWVRLSPGHLPWRRPLISLFLTVWLVGAFDAARHVASLTTYPLAVRLLLGLSMGPLGTLWATLKALGVLVDAAEAPNMAWLVIVPWSPLFLLPALLFVAGASLEVERQRLRYSEMRSRRRSPGSGGFRRGRKYKKGGYR